MNARFLVIDKPPGVTSHDVVAVVRAVTGIRKVGHTGTLDPFATGVLPLAIGAATRLIQFIDEDLKVYDATIALGSATDTGDPTGAVVEQAPVPGLDVDAVESVLSGYRGERMQAPPAYSAVKVSGRRLYDYAREGQPVEAAARPVRVDFVRLVDLSADRLRVVIQCGRGTYARVLADEIARDLGTCGHLVALRRTRSGPFEEAQALGMPALAEIVAGRTDWPTVLRPARGAERVPWRHRDEVRDDLEPWLLRPEDVLSGIPVVDLDEGDAAAVRASGRTSRVPEGIGLGGRFLARQHGEVIAVMRREPSWSRVERMVVAGR